jgi:hypothetical protein
MEPIPINAVAIEWQFRCRRTEMPRHGWEWRCRSGDGQEIASSVRTFGSLDDAIEDARRHGFVGTP